eukprot:COSAG01_NODE_4906_length_4639_cov_10.348018_4_plen_283_part_00
MPALFTQVVCRYNYVARKGGASAKHLFQKAHVDVGLLTAAPLMTIPGYEMRLRPYLFCGVIVIVRSLDRLQVLQQVQQSNGIQRWEWVSVEGDTPANSLGEDWIVFGGKNSVTHTYIHTYIHTNIRRRTNITQISDDICAQAGEVLNVLTGNAIPPVFHRVVLSPSSSTSPITRVSMPFFQRPPRESWVQRPAAHDALHATDTTDAGAPVPGSPICCSQAGRYREALTVASCAAMEEQWSELRSDTFDRGGGWEMWDFYVNVLQKRLYNRVQLDDMLESLTQ